MLQNHGSIITMKELDTVETLSAGAARDPKPKLGLLQLNSKFCWNISSSVWGT